LRRALLASTTLAIINLAASVSGASAQSAQFWGQATGNSFTFGGSGTWNATDHTWADQNGQNVGAWLGADGVFTGSAGTVTVQGTQQFQSLRFSSDGYQIISNSRIPGYLAPIGSGTLQADSSVTATLTIPIVGAGGLTKTGAGTIILTGFNGGNT